ncbi:MAG: DNA polymerase III subunit alpha [Burkholderia sp.]|nr:DNA polymerase III subunit alpha [Burkholderia sp.]
MSDPRFVHLRVHSEFSIADSIVRLDDIIKAASADNQTALALTDLSNVFGLVRFYTKACINGIKPIIGCDVWIKNPDDQNRPSRLLLLVKDKIGYLNLCKLLSKAWLTNQYCGRAELNKQWLETELAEGLLALSGAQYGDIGLAFSNGNEEAAYYNAKRWSACFPGRFYIELQRYGQAGAETYIQQASMLAISLGLPVVATHPTQFMSAEDFTAHEVRVCISESDILENPKRQKHFTTDQFFRTQEQMVTLFTDLPSSITNTIEIAKRCNLILEFGKPKLPIFPTPDGVSLDDYLVKLSKEGLERRLEQLYLDTNERDAKSKIYYERLNFECKTITKIGFSSYFLIVGDFINWAKKNSIPVGPGRGSGAGSLVAFALGITDLDPLLYNLIFERFLNPERVSMPDFDIDFCQYGRDRVIQYVKEKYGTSSVSQIATFGTMAAKAAIRDVGRVLDLGYIFTDSIAKLIPFRPGKHITISEAMKEEPLLQERYDNEDEVRQLLNLAQCVEGLTRNVGMHAGGILIAPSELTDFCPLYTQGDNSAVVSQYDKNDVEAVGLVKFDFLGLTTLTILDLTKRYISMLDTRTINLSLTQVPLDDQKSFELLKKANTVAVFQLESRGMQEMLKDAHPDRFEDIIALVSLYRPGPMDLIQTFCERKHGREKVNYPDPRVELILKETYGIMVYQEQVMQMAQIIAGYSLGSADLLRRAMGKKKPEEMAKHRELFRKGAAKNGLTSYKANEIFDLMEKFAGYGFNKSHATAYAMLAYHTAWMKANHLAEFMAANMTLAIGDIDKIKILFDDCIANGLTILQPDINESHYGFLPIAQEDGKRSSTIRYGLGALKGSGQNAIEEILRARIQKKFIDLFDFCKRINRRIVNRRIIEVLVRSGAFDLLHKNRARLFKAIPLAIQAADQAETNVMQTLLFDDTELKLQQELIDDMVVWDEKQRLREEKNAIGFYLSRHLFDAYRIEIRRFAQDSLSEIKEGRDKIISGIIISMRTQMSKHGKILIVLLDDGTGQCEISVFNEQFKVNKALFKEDELLIVNGYGRRDSFNNRLRFTANFVMNLERARSLYGRAVQLTMNTNTADIVELRRVLKSHLINSIPQIAIVDKNTTTNNIRYRSQQHALQLIPVGLGVQILYSTQYMQAKIRLGDKWRVNPSDIFLEELRAAFKDSVVEIEY